MRCPSPWSLAILAILSVGGRSSGDGPSEFRKSFDGIVAEQRKAREQFNATWPRIEAMKKAGASQGDRDRVQREATDLYIKAVESDAGRVLDLVRSHPDDPAVAEALTFVIETARAGPTDHSWQALKILARDHARDPGMGKLGGITFYFFFMPEVESLLRGVLDRNPSREERARACYNLADHLAYKARVLGMFREGAMSIANYPEPWRRPLVEQFLRTEDAGRLNRESEDFLERCLAEFGDIPFDPIDGRPMGEVVRGKLFAIRNLAIGQAAPEIRGTDADGVPFGLGDYRGKVVVLTFSGNWCGPCVGMYPRERALLERYKNEPFAIVSVDTGKDKETLLKSIRDGEITWRCWWDGGTDGPITTTWGVSSFPSVFVLDREGVIRFKDVREEALDKAVRSLLEPRKEAP